MWIRQPVESCAHCAQQLVLNDELPASNKKLWRRKSLIIGDVLEGAQGSSHLSTHLQEKPRIPNDIDDDPKGSPWNERHL